MPWKIILVGILSLISGFLLGRMVPNPASDDREISLENSGRSANHGSGFDRMRASTKSVRSQPSDRNVSLQTLADASGLVDPAAHGSLIVVPAELLENLSGKHGTRTLEQDLFSQDGKVEAALQITEREKAAIQQSWRETREQIEKIKASASESEELADGSVSIKIPDISDKIGKIGDDFKTGTGDILGPNRAEAFTAMKQIGSAFDSQKGTQTYTIKADSIGDGSWRYHITISNGDQITSQLVTRNIPSPLRSLTDKAGIRPDLTPIPEEPEW